jgi:hypothetical protein
VLEIKTAAADGNLLHRLRWRGKLGGRSPLHRHRSFGHERRKSAMITRIHVQFGTVLLGVMILACPGAANDGKARSRFAGSYTGKYVSHPGGNAEDQEGVVTSSVDEKGNISGEATNTTLNQTAKISGTIDEDGRVKMVYEFPSATYTATGTASKTAKGTIIGTLIQWSGMRAISSIEFESTPKK